MHRGRPLVLVVDDDSDARCNFVTWLSEAGYRCITTDEVSTALWYVRRLAPEVTVVDIGGRAERDDLAAYLASDPDATSLVIASSANVSAALSSLPVGHVAKPGTADEVVRAVTAARLMNTEAAACS